MTDEQVKQTIRANFPELTDLNYSEIGRLAGVEPISVSRVARGLVNPSLGYATRLCDALGCTLNDLLETDQIRSRN